MLGLIFRASERLSSKVPRAARTVNRTAQIAIVFVALGTAAGGVAAHHLGYIDQAFDYFAEQKTSPAGPVANIDGKRDRLAPELRLREASRPAGELVTLSLETAHNYLEFPQAVRPAAIRAAPKPLPKASSALLNDATLASMKARLKLTKNQERYWGPVEDALRIVVAKLYEAHRRNPVPSTIPISLEGEELTQLKQAVGPFIRQLNETQKNEVRALARIVGLESTIFKL